MKRAFSLLGFLLLGLLTGCSSFKLGAMAYCPHGHVCSHQSAPASAEPASAPAL